MKLFSPIMFGLSLLALTTAACRGATPVSSSSPEASSFLATEPVQAPPQATLFQPIPQNPDEGEAGALWEDYQMPVFLEVTQTTIMNKDAIQSPVIGVGPTVYFYDPDSKSLMFHSTITLEPATELIVGVMTVLQTPDQVYEKREIVQFPSAQPALVQISSLEQETGKLNLVYADESFSLTPGESRTFKFIGGDTKTATVVILFANYGRLADIQPVSSDGSWR